MGVGSQEYCKWGNSIVYTFNTKIYQLELGMSSFLRLNIIYTNGYQRFFIITYNLVEAIIFFSLKQLKQTQSQTHIPF